MNHVAPGTSISYTLAPWELGCYIAIVVTAILFLLAVGVTIYKFKKEKTENNV
jgi:beta-glucosidase